jgi:hypothetical protein
MTVKAHSSILFTVVDGAAKWQVAMLPGAVAVYGEGGKQYFSNPRDLPAKRLKEVFPSEAMMRKAANLDTLTKVDIRRLMASIEKIYNSRLISASELRSLQDLLGNCDCTPEAMKDKVRRAGLGRVLHLLVIEDHNPALDATVRVLKLFVEGISRVAL